MLVAEDGSVALRCPICERWCAVTEMHQLLPCLHLFCTSCISKSAKKVCLMYHCFSNLFTETLTVNNCENELCPRKLSFYESSRVGNCGHELCTGCLEDLAKIRKSACPVAGCNGWIGDRDDTDSCEGCKKSLVDIKFVITKCCAARYCHQCVTKKLRFTSTSEEGLLNVTCPEGQCIQKTSRKSRPRLSAVQIAHCLGEQDCEGTALNGFPSNAECEHDVCLKCLDRMLDECQATGSPPICPNALCRQPYNVDSVIALKAYFPQRARYFNIFALENQGYDIIKDDTVSKCEVSPDFTVSERRMEVKCELEGFDEGETAVVIFDKNGNVADLIREIRRALKILPLDKVYGFYIRHDNRGDKNDDKIADEELQVDAKSINRPVSELNLTPGSVIVVDVRGIVQAKQHHKGLTLHH